VITLSGASAEIRWGYHITAVLADWTVVEGVLSARIVSCDPVQVEQAGLSFVVGNRDPFPPVRRTLTEVHVTGGTLIARLGPKE
jgi:hypothetical protein